MPNYRNIGKHGFPHADNVNVYKYDNDINYSRYDYTQMDITVCSVPWDQGEAHVGNRTLKGIGNVVYFGSKDARDKWFADIPDNQCFRWQTKYRNLHMTGSIDVPLPFDVACEYNYLFVQYRLFANDDSKVEYETDDGTRTWCYFVRDVEFVAPNTTRLSLLPDAWQTFIYDVDVTGMILERGHAPLVNTNVDSYLASPIDNCRDLLAEDVNYGELQKVTSEKHVILNSGSMYACIVTSSKPWGDWGKKHTENWQTPGSEHETVSGTPAIRCIAVKASKLNDVLDDVVTNVPQFIQTIQCIFFCARKYLNLDIDNEFKLGGRSFYRIIGNDIDTTALNRFQKSDFGYDSRYAELAKLYTYPYAAIEMTDEKGDSEIIRIEDTASKIDITATANLVFPYLKMICTVKGIGGNRVKSVSFSNMTEKSFDFSGRWYNYLKEWDIPTFCVTISNENDYDVNTYFDHQQMENDRNTARGIAKRDASATKTTADNSANTTATNAVNIASANASASKTIAAASATTAKRSANAITANAATQTAANTAITSTSNTASETEKSYINGYATALQAWDAGFTRDTANNEVKAENQSASIAAGAAIANGAASGLSSGNPLGIIGNVARGAISAATTLGQNAVATNLKTTQAETVVNYSANKLHETTRNNSDRNSNQTSTNTKLTNTANKATNTIAANNTDVGVKNADTAKNAAYDAADTTSTAAKNAANATKTTTKSNNTTSYNAAVSNADDIYANSGKRIANLVSQSKLGAPKIYGSVSNAEYATTKPMGLFFNVVTQSDYSISLAGDEFLRYGYMYNKQWEFDGNWCAAPKFTFWKLRDFWVNSNNVPDLYMDMIRFFLYGGVTVWRNPNDIGKVSIYGNR